MRVGNDCYVNEGAAGDTHDHGRDRNHFSMGKNIRQTKTCNNEDSGQELTEILEPVASVV